MAKLHPTERLQPNVWYVKPDSRRSPDVIMPSNRYGSPSRSSLASLGIRMEGPEDSNYFWRGGPYPPGDNYMNQPYPNMPSHYPNMANHYPPTRYVPDVNRYGTHDLIHQNRMGYAPPCPTPNYNEPGSVMHRDERYSHTSERQEAVITETRVRKVVVPTFNMQRGFDDAFPQHYNSFGFDESSFSQRSAYQGNVGNRYRMEDRGNDFRPPNVWSMHMQRSVYGRALPDHLQPMRYGHETNGGHVSRRDGSVIHSFQPDNNVRQVQLYQHPQLDEPVNDRTNSVVNESGVIRSVNRGEGNAETTQNQFHTNRYKVAGNGSSGTMSVPSGTNNETSVISSLLECGGNVQIRTGPDGVDAHVSNQDSNVSGGIERNGQGMLPGHLLQIGGAFDTDGPSAVVSNGVGTNDDHARNGRQKTQRSNGDVERRLPFNDDVVQKILKFHTDRPKLTNSDSKVQDDGAEPIENRTSSGKEAYKLSRVSENSFVIVPDRQSGQFSDKSSSNTSDNRAVQVSTNQLESSNVRDPQNVELPDDPTVRDASLVEVYLGSPDVLVNSEQQGASKQSSGLENTGASANVQGNTPMVNLTGQFYGVYQGGPYAMFNRHRYIMSGSGLQQQTGQGSCVNLQLGPFPRNYALLQLGNGQSSTEVAGNKKKKPVKKRTPKIKDPTAVPKDPKPKQPRKRAPKKPKLMSQDVEDIVVEVDLPSYLNLFGGNVESGDEKTEEEEADIVEVDPESLIIQDCDEPKTVPDESSGGSELLKKCLKASASEGHTSPLKGKETSKTSNKTSTSLEGVDRRYSHLIRDCYVKLERCDSKLKTSQSVGASRSLLINELLDDAKKQMGTPSPKKHCNQASSSKNETSEAEEDASMESKADDVCQIGVGIQSIANSSNEQSDATAVVGEEPEEDIAETASVRVYSSSEDSDEESAASGPVTKESKILDNREIDGVVNSPVIHKNTTNKVANHHKAKGSKQLLRLSAFWETPSDSISQQTKHFKSVTSVPCPPSPPRSSSSSPVCYETPTSGLDSVGYSEHDAPSPPCTPPNSRAPVRHDSGATSALTLLKDVKLALVKCDSVMKRLTPKSNEARPNTVDVSPLKGGTPVKSTADQVSPRRLSLKMLQPVVLLDKLDNRKSLKLAFERADSLEHRPRNISGSVGLCASPSLNSPNKRVAMASNSPNRLKRCYVRLERIDSRIRLSSDAKRQRLCNES